MLIIEYIMDDDNARVLGFLYMSSRDERSLQACCVLLVLAEICQPTESKCLCCNEIDVVAGNTYESTISH